MPVDVSGVAGQEPKEIAKGWYRIRIKDQRLVDTKQGKMIASEQEIVDDPNALSEDSLGFEYTDFIRTDMSRVPDRFRKQEINKLSSFLKAQDVDPSEGMYDEQGAVGITLDAFLVPSTSQEGFATAKVLNYDAEGARTEESSF